MPLDQTRYQDLIAGASFDASFYKGTIQDQSSRSLAMSFVGAPTWTRVNGKPAISQAGSNANYVMSTAAVASLVDLTGTFSLELLFCASAVERDRPIQQIDGTNTGIIVQRESASTSYVYLYSGGAIVRSIGTPAGATAASLIHHLVFTSVAGGTSGYVWHRGIPLAATLSGAGAAANPAASIVRLGLGASGLGETLVVRLWQQAFGNPDANCLAEAAREMVGGW